MASGKKTGGRQKGTPNKRTEEREAVAQQVSTQIETTLPNAFKGDAHALLMLIYKNVDLELSVRMDAAKAALPYEKGRLSPVEGNKPKDDHVPLADRLKEYGREDAIQASGGKVVGIEQKRAAR